MKGKVFRGATFADISESEYAVGRLQLDRIDWNNSLHPLCPHHGLQSPGRTNR